VNQQEVLLRYRLARISVDRPTRWGRTDSQHALTSSVVRALIGLHGHQLVDITTRAVAGSAGRTAFGLVDHPLVDPVKPRSSFAVLKTVWRHALLPHIAPPGDAMSIYHFDPSTVTLDISSTRSSVQLHLSVGRRLASSLFVRADNATSLNMKPDPVRIPVIHASRGRGRLGFVPSPRARLGR